MSGTLFINGKFLSQRLTGVQRYALELTRSLVKTDTDVKVLVPAFLDTTRSGLPSGVIVRTGSFRNTILWEQVDLPRFMNRNRDHLLLSLCNTGPVSVKNQVVCIHDLSCFENPEWFSKKFYYYYRFMLPKMTKVARHLVTVSEFSKGEICGKLGCSPGRVSVVYNAPSEPFIQDSAAGIDYNKDDFFLFVGSLDPRKNLKALTEVFAAGEFGKQSLFIVGAGSQKVFNSVSLRLPPNVHVLDRCDDLLLSRLYRKARALINCSLYEGFGLPVVEAMASGCPLLLSDISPFREIAGEGAVFFDPASASSIRSGLNEFLRKNEADLRRTIGENYRKSRTYSWEGSRDRLLDAIRSLPE